ncbi:hypothetical protein D3C75_956700 [compost metagenome]
MIPASTTACPKMSAPTMDTVDPIARGMRTPASRKISNVISISIASMKAGNGTPSRWAIKLTSSNDGIIS